MYRQEDLDDFSSQEYRHLEPSAWLKPGIDFKDLPAKFKIYSKSLNEWLFFRRKPANINYFQVPRDKLKNFPPNSGTYELADTQNPVAVIVPSQNSEIQTHAVHYGAGISGPCMTPRGVELVIANTVANPNIRWIILAGNDSAHLAGDMIDALVSYGIDESRRVINARSPTFPYLKNLPGEVIERFRKQVEAMNLLKCSDTDVIGFVVRMCLQEDSNAFLMHVKGRNYHLFDRGAVSGEPMLFDFSVAKLGAVFDNYGAFSGTSIHALTVAEAFSNLQGLIMQRGSWGKQESSRMALECTNTSITVHDTANGRVPPDYLPQSWLQTEDDTMDYLDKYSRWIYLFPLSDVRYDAKLKKTVPGLAENLEYSYGTRLTAYGFETCRDKFELSALKDLVVKLQQKFYEKAPEFGDVLSAYDRMAAFQDKTFNSLYRMAKGCATAVRDGIGNSYRMYATLQIPSVDLACESPYEMHNPCFCHYQPNPRFMKYAVVESGGVKRKVFLPSIPNGEEKKFGEVKEGWFLFPLMVMRAHDIMAFPSNAAGGITISEFIAWYVTQKTGKKVELGHYTQFASSVHILDYAMDKKVLERLNGK